MHTEIYIITANSKTKTRDNPTLRTKAQASFPHSRPAAVAKIPDKPYRSPPIYDFRLLLSKSGFFCIGVPTVQVQLSFVNITP